LNGLELPLPPLKEQKRIVAEVERRLRAIDNIAMQVKAALEQTTEFRTAIFHRALSGKLVNQNRSEEPAIELLSRIQKLKDQRAKQPKVRAIAPPKIKLEKLPMLTLEDIKPTHLADILRQHKSPLDAKALWKESQLTIDDFYAQLKKELGKSLKETGNDRLLEAKP
jgi:type I restriction enzyme S subunit